MSVNQDPSDKFERLRKQAEKQIQRHWGFASKTPADILELLHELRIHQAELEIQNEELREAQQEISALHQEYEKLYEFAPFGYVTLNSKGIVTRVNLTGVRLLGTARQYLLQSTFSGFIAPEWEHVYMDARRNAGETGEKQSIELQLKRENESPIWVRADIEADRDKTDAVIQWRIVLVDITEKKAAEASLSKSEILHRTTIENISDTVIITDDEGKCIYVFPNAKDIFGWTTEEIYTLGNISALLGRNIVDPKKLWEKKQINDVELAVRDKHGKKHDLLVNIKSINLINGTILYTCRDITRLKRTEEKLRILNKSLDLRIAKRTAELEDRTHQLQKIAMELSDAEDRERRQIATVLHDDFQQQLAYLKIEIDLMARDNADRKVGKRLVFLKQIISECINKSRNISYDLNPPSLNRGGLLSALEAIAQDMKQKYGLEIKLKTQPEAEPNSRTLASILYRSAKELLTNIAKHAGVNSATVEVDCQNGIIQIRIEDFGKGFDYDAAKSHHGKGSGFGLYNVEDRMAFLGGSMKVQTSPGKGCSVVLTVPKNVSRRQQVPAPLPKDTLNQEFMSAESAEPDQWVGKKGKIRILMADDHQLMREALAKLLQNVKGLTVVGQAVDGPEVIAMAEQLKPDVILMDISMPEIDGVEATAQILRNHPHIRIIGLSMHNDTHTRQKMLDAGACAYLTKAGLPDILVKTIRQVHQSNT